MGVFGSKQQPLPTVPTDTIVPFAFFDDLAIFKAVILDLTLRFDDQLDVTRLRTSLEELFDYGDWRKLGARIRKTKSGKLEYHIPERFDDKRPAFRFTTAAHSCSINEHPLASKLPRATANTSTHPDANDFVSLTRHPDTYRHLDDLLNQDESGFWVHVVTFSDATLVTVTFPHATLDGIAAGHFLDAWSKVVRGEKESLPKFHGFANDPLDTLGRENPQDYALASHELKGWPFFKFVVGYLFERVWWRKETSHTVCIPKAFMDSMKQDAQGYLSSQRNADGTTPFVSSNDLIVSWWLKTVLKHWRPNPKRTMTVMVPYHLRDILSDDLLPKGSVYLSNAVLGIFSMFTASQITESSVAKLALRLRNNLKEQGTREQMEAFAALSREREARSGRPAIFGDSSAELFNVSNWTKANFFDVDFSPAVVGVGIPLSDRPNASGRPSFVQPTASIKGFSTRFAGAVYGKDAAGNFWMNMTLRTETWEGIEKEFREQQASAA